MVVAVPEEVALPRVAAVDHAVQALQVAVVAHAQAALPRHRRARELRGAHLAVARIGVGREETGQPLPGLVAHALERRVGRRGLARVVAGAGGIRDAQLVGLRFVGAAVLEEQQPQRLLGHAAVATEALGERRGETEAEPEELLLGDALGGVAVRDVADLVPQHARQLRLGVQVREDAARHVDVAARHGERVHRGIIEHGEVPRQVRQVRGPRDLLAHTLDVGLERRIVVPAVLLEDRLVALLADLQLLRRAHQRDLPPPGHRVDGAARCDDDRGGEQQGETPRPATEHNGSSGPGASRRAAPRGEALTGI